MRITLNERKIDLSYILVLLILFWILQSCDSDSEERTRTETIGGGLLPERQVEVTCDFPEAEPLGTNSQGKV